MTTHFFKGDAPAVAQVQTLTVGGTIETDDLFKHTIGNKVLSTAAGSTVAATVATTLRAAWNALTAAAGYEEFAEVTAGGSSADVVLTADTAGKPFTSTGSTTEANGAAADLQTYNSAATTASAGPNDLSTVANLSGNAALANSDTFIVDDGDSILYGLAQSGVTLTQMDVNQRYAGKIGLPLQNSGGYSEYRDHYLAIGTTALNIGKGTGSGSGRIKINNGSILVTGNLYNTGSTAEAGLKAFIWKGTHANNAWNVYKGSMDVAPFAGETATIENLRVAYIANQANDADVRCGTGVTLQNIEQSGGKLEIASGTTSVVMTAGELNILAGAHAALNIKGGTLNYRSSGTITTLTLGPGAVADFSKDLRSKTITNLVMSKGSKLVDPHKVLTITNGIDLYECGLADVTIDLGKHFTLSRSAI